MVILLIVAGWLISSAAAYQMWRKQAWREDRQWTISDRMFALPICLVSGPMGLVAMALIPMVEWWRSGGDGPAKW